MFKSVIKALAGVLAFVALIPAFIFYYARIVSYVSITQTLSFVPGFPGIMLRRVWYKCTLASCGRELTVDFLAWIRTPKTRVGNNVYVGVQSLVGWADIGDDVMISGQVVVLSGNRQHGYQRLDVPMRLQEGVQEKLTIGNDVWVGVGAILASSVAAHSVVASGAIVTKQFAEFDILGGVPAKVIKSRKDKS